MALDVSKINQVSFPDDQYYRSVVEKNQIVIHHTVSGHGINGDVNHWKASEARVATSLIIDRKGDIHQCFSTKYYAHHLGIKRGFILEQKTTKSNLELNQKSIAIELDSYGGLEKKGSKYITVYGNEVPAKSVVSYKEKYRGYKYYEKYTDKQISALKDVLEYLTKKYDIPFKYKEDMWDVSKDALNGVSGIYSHTSYRADKSDCHPQPELISMIKGEKKKTSSPAKKRSVEKKTSIKLKTQSNGAVKKKATKKADKK